MKRTRNPHVFVTTGYIDNRLRTDVVQYNLHKSKFHNTRAHTGYASSAHLLRYFFISSVGCGAGVAYENHLATTMQECLGLSTYRVFNACSGKRLRSRQRRLPCRYWEKRLGHGIRAGRKLRRGTLGRNRCSRMLGHRCVFGQAGRLQWVGHIV
jgi:hypothetical protein